MTLERNTGTGEPVGPLGLRVGQNARRSKTMIARDVELYAQITGDRNPLHSDVAFAARTRFGRLVAQGGITAGMLNALVAMDLPGAGTVFMSQSLRCRADLSRRHAHRRSRGGLRQAGQARLPAPGRQVFVTDGNALLSTTGRASNYLRAASANNNANTSAPEAEDLQAVFSYILDDKPLPAKSSERLPSLRKGKLIYKFNNLLRLRAIWLPDVVMFLDVDPELALTRIKSRGKKINRHENLADLKQAREMYLKTLRAFQAYRTQDAAHVIRVDDLSLGETLRAVEDALKPHLISARVTDRTAIAPLGTSELADETIRRKTVNHRYFLKYLLPKWFSGTWREPTFFFRSLGGCS